MDNITGAGDNSPELGVDTDLEKSLSASYYVIETFYILIGTPLNAWLIMAILTSTNMRRLLRNQLICMVHFSYLLKTSIGGLLRIVVIALGMSARDLVRCQLVTFHTYFRLVTEFAGSWYIVILLIVFLIQIAGHDPTSTLRPVTVILGRITVLVAPSLLGIMILPMIGSGLQPEHLSRQGTCFYVTSVHFNVFRSLDYFVPLLVSSVLLTVSILFYYRRFHRCISFFLSTRSELMGRGPLVDNLSAYIVVVFLNTSCRFLNSVAFLTEIGMDINKRILYDFVTWIIVDATSILLPWGWLFLDDIRDRIKVWRPWYRPTLGVDLKVAYGKEHPDTARWNLYV